MAKECYVCNKGVIAGNTISHSNRHTKRIWKPNLRKVKININNTTKKVYVCISCMTVAERIKK